MVNYGYELLEVCNKRHISICEYTLEEEAKTAGSTYEQVFEKMRKNLQVMKSSTEIGLNNEIISISGIIGGDAYKLNKYLKEGKTLTGDFMVTAMARALSSSEVNASMGNIVAAPTAGSCGIIPANNKCRRKIKFNRR